MIQHYFHSEQELSYRRRMIQEQESFTPLPPDKDTTWVPKNTEVAGPPCHRYWSFELTSMTIKTQLTGTKTGFPNFPLPTQVVPSVNTTVWEVKI